MGLPTRSFGIGRTLQAESAQGILYPSLRHRGGECLAALRTTLLKNCLHAAYLEYNMSICLESVVTLYFLPASARNPMARINVWMRLTLPA